MIRVTVELIPGGVGDPLLLAQGEIWNDLEDALATGGRRGSYHWLFRGKRGPGKRSVYDTRVTDYARNSMSVWNLVTRCLKQAGYR